MIVAETQDHEALRAASEIEANVKAMVIRRFGPPEVMVLEDVPKPVAGPGEVVIEVHAVSVNSTLDARVRAGRYERPVTLPHVVGVDPSGIIVEREKASSIARSAIVCPHRRI